MQFYPSGLLVFHTKFLFVSFEWPHTLPVVYHHPQVMHWTRDNVRTLVLKFPLILNYQTARVQHLMCVLQQVSSKRAQWRQDFAAMTPSLVAFYIKDAKDMLLRLEFLIETGEGQNMNFRTIFKASNNLFTKKYANFRSWQRMRKQQDQQQQQQPRLQQRMHG